MGDDFANCSKLRLAMNPLRLQVHWIRRVCGLSRDVQPTFILIRELGESSTNAMTASQLLRRFTAYYRPHKRLVALDIICAVVSGLLELGFPLAVSAFVDRLLPGQNWPLILLATAVLLLIYGINTGLMAIVTYWGHMLGINIETEMRRKSFDHLQKLSFRFYDNHKTGHLVARVTKDLEEIGEIAHHGPEDLLIAVMTFIGAFVLMLHVQPQLALITAVIVPVTGWITSRYGGRMTQNWHALFGRVGDFNARIEENVGGIRVVQAFANEGSRAAPVRSRQRSLP